MIPQIIVLVLWFISLLLVARLHGQEKTGKHSFWVTLISILITAGLFYWGGFFDVFFKQ